MKSNLEMLKGYVHNFDDDFIIEKCNEIDQRKDTSGFVRNMAKNIYDDKELVINCIFEEYDQRKKRLGFRVLILCSWIKNLKNYFNENKNKRIKLC